MHLPVVNELPSEEIKNRRWVSPVLIEYAQSLPVTIVSTLEVLDFHASWTRTFTSCPSISGRARTSIASARTTRTAR